MAIRIFESHCGSAPPHSSSAVHPLHGGGTYLLVIEVICAEVVKEFIHDLVVIHDLRDPFLQGQVVMKDTCAWRVEVGVI